MLATSAEGACLDEDGRNWLLFPNLYPLYLGEGEEDKEDHAVTQYQQ